MFGMSMKKITLAIFFLINFLTFKGVYSDTPQKFVIGGRDAGFFSNFLGVLNNLHWCVKNNMNPVVIVLKNDVFIYYDSRGCNNIISDNIWDYYFYPVSDFAL